MNKRVLASRTFHGRASHKQRFKATTDSKHLMPVAVNLLARNFKPSAPNKGWTGDTTYIATGEGWLYLAIVLDQFNREIVGWSIKPRMTAGIVIDALSMAWFRSKPEVGVVFNSLKNERVHCTRYATKAEAEADLKLEAAQRANAGVRN